MKVDMTGGDSYNEDFFGKKSRKNLSILYVSREWRIEGDDLLAQLQLNYILFEIG
ncbi:MAG: hypothetical protein OXC44_03165 [Proteobacteria bacterium]|nr:hypothetical protein [Pseudomonadota bacterium]